MIEATVVPCTPYEKSVYDLTLGAAAVRKVEGFAVRVHDNSAMFVKYGVPFIEVDGKFIGAMPNYA